MTRSLVDQDPLSHTLQVNPNVRYKLVNQVDITGTSIRPFGVATADSNVTSMTMALTESVVMCSIASYPIRLFSAVGYIPPDRHPFSRKLDIAELLTNFLFSLWRQAEHPTPEGRIDRLRALVIASRSSRLFDMNI